MYLFFSVFLLSNVADSWQGSFHRSVMMKSAATEEEYSSLQSRIEELEASVVAKKLELEKLRDLTDDSGKNGYYRLAAQIETFKRTTAGSAERSTERTKATVCRALMPVLEAFEEVDDEGEQRISKTYQQVYQSLIGALAEIGLEPFHAVLGETFDAAKHVSSDPSDAQEDGAKVVVAAEVRPGYRILSTGDIVRPAKCELSVEKAATESDKNEEEGE